MCMGICMSCAWAGRVHVPVRTSGGCTGTREPGTPEGPGVYICFVARLRKAGAVCHTVSPRHTRVSRSAPCRECQTVVLARCFAHAEQLFLGVCPQKQGELLGESSGRGRYGGLSASLQKLERTYLKAQRGYHEDTVYVCGEPRIDSVSGEVHIVLSTDNLLLNAYRQTLFGLPSYVQIDTTHRLICEGHCVMPITTVDCLQHTHVISYGIVNSESIASHTYVIEQTRLAVNAIVRERAEAKECV